MSNTINFGIDLGTTNSVIAKYQGGKVEVFKNPVGHKETLPSVVAFRNERIMVGDKAREYLEKDPSNVVGSFKRKMGTSETFAIKSLGREVSPVELSSYVLKELKNFVHTGESLDSAVITIPASFDTIQSNATKKAGYEAGFKEVVLLQEPIAASLAYANKADSETEENGKWLVYDLGGGTFDVALVTLKDGEMKVLDHEGDNFLGGMDFDNRIVERILVPYLENTYGFIDLENALKSASGKYNKLYFKLLKKAEEVKVQLSSAESTEIEFEVEDMNGDEHEVYFNISKTDFEEVIADKVYDSLQMISQILQRNELTASDIKFCLMIGGSSFIPLVRQLIPEKLGIEVNCSIDPTTAVALGAAFYAGTKTKTITENQSDKAGQTNNVYDIRVKTAYQKTSREDEEYFTAQVDGKIEGLFYRIVREDGGYDTGLKVLKNRISDYLALEKDTANSFRLNLYDGQNNLIECGIPKIEITQGKFNVLGQPLPHDICIEVDDYENNVTKLEVIFEKNALLPLKRTITKEISRTIKRGMNEGVVINVLEGPRFATPQSNSTIGAIEISGKELTRDLVKGSDVEITLEMSESRDLKISTYLLMTDQEFSNVFNPTERHILTTKLRDDIETLLHHTHDEIRENEDREEFEIAAQLTFLEGELETIFDTANRLTADDVTDARYQLEDKKKKLAQKFDNLTRDKKITEVQTEYFEWKHDTASLLEEVGNESDKKQLKDLISNEKIFLNSNNSLYIKGITEKIRDLYFRVEWRRPGYVIACFYWISNDKKELLRDQNRADSLIQSGEKAIEKESYEELRVITNQLASLLPEKEKSSKFMKGTGIG